MVYFVFQQPDTSRQAYNGSGVGWLCPERLIGLSSAAPAPRLDRWRAARDRMAAPAATY